MSLAEDLYLQSRILAELDRGMPMTELQIASRLNETVRATGIQLESMRLLGVASRDEDTALWVSKRNGVTMRAPADDPLQVSIMLALEDSREGLEANQLAGRLKMSVGPIVAQLWHLQNSGRKGQRVCFNRDSKRYDIVSSRP